MSINVYRLINKFMHNLYCCFGWKKIEKHLLFCPVCVILFIKRCSFVPFYFPNSLGSLEMMLIKILVIFSKCLKVENNCQCNDCLIQSVETNKCGRARMHTYNKIGYPS